MVGRGVLEKFYMLEKYYRIENLALKYIFFSHG